MPETLYYSLNIRLEAKYFHNWFLAFWSIWLILFIKSRKNLFDRNRIKNLINKCNFTLAICFRHFENGTIGQIPKKMSIIINN